MSDKVVTLFSGGTGSWAAAMRVAEQYGPENQTLLFTDTKSEDADLYRFLDEAAELVGSELVTIADGRDLWGVFNEENCPPDEWKVALGIDWTEAHRYERAAPRWLPYELIAPLCEKPYLDKQQIHADLTARGVEIPRLYEWSAHNNCGGFCVKAGHAQFKALLLNMPGALRPPRSQRGGVQRLHRKGRGDHARPDRRRIQAAHHEGLSSADRGAG